VLAYEVNTLRLFKLIYAVMFFLVLALSAQAQSGDWRALKSLPPDTRISVKIRFRTLCDFQYATDDRLVCERIMRGPIPFGPDHFSFARKQIREVRLEHSDNTNALVGATVGGGIGVVLGAAGKNDTTTREGGALLLGGIGAIAGGIIGKDFPITHGKVVYKR
jgi:hypothetical protein